MDILRNWKAGKDHGVNCTFIVFGEYRCDVRYIIGAFEATDRFIARNNNLLDNNLSIRYLESATTMWFTFRLNTFRLNMLGVIILLGIVLLACLTRK